VEVGPGFRQGLRAFLCYVPSQASANHPARAVGEERSIRELDDGGVSVLDDVIVGDDLAVSGLENHSPRLFPRLPHWR